MMPDRESKNHSHRCQGVTTPYIVILSFSLIIFSFLLQGNIGINLADEGFLWYGVNQTAEGEISLRDFQSYYPGRYCWAAAWSKIFGPGIIGLRLSIALFQVIGLCFGLLVARRAVSSLWILFLLGIILTVWMFPRHKLFEPSLVMAAIYFAVLLIEKPSVQRHFISGLFVGLAAFFGPNHGLYGAAAFFLLIMFIRLKTNTGNLSRRLVCWGLGIVVGFSPMIFMVIFVPGFFDTLVASVASIFRSGTNLPLTVPLPWVVISNIARMPDIEIFYSAFQLFGSMCFLVMPIFYVAVILTALFSGSAFLRRGSVVIACAVVGLFYQHHAFARADMGHLAQTLQPFLIGVVAIPCAFGIEKNKWITPVMTLIMCTGIFSGLWAHDYYHYFQAQRSNNEFIKYQVGSDLLLLNPGQTQLMDNVARIVTENSEKSDDVLIAPHWPGFYPVLNRKSPVWEIYFVFPSTEAKQRRMISEMEKANLKVIIIGDVPLDGRDDLRFKNTHPLLWAYMLSNFEAKPADGLPDNYKLFVRKRGNP